MEMGHSRSKNQDAIDGRRVDESEAQGMRECYDNWRIGAADAGGGDGDATAAISEQSESCEPVNECSAEHVAAFFARNLAP